MNGVIYARYSDASQREESIEGQIRECKEYAQRNGIRIINIYVDRALSAKTDNRPDFQRMIQDSEKGLFDVVMVWKLDRFARNRFDSAHYKAILRKNGVKILSAMENISNGPEGIILESLLEGMAEYYSAELSQKIHRGQHENALKGKNNGGSIPFGYLLGTDKKLVVDPLTSPVVVEIFQRYSEGESIKSIAENLNHRQIRTRKNKPFSIGSFYSILRNRKYIGEYRYQDVIIPDGVPRIISEDLFYRVQERLAKNKHAPARTKSEEGFLLTTKLFCGECRHMMVGESGTSHTGKTYFYYKCAAAKRRKGCKKKAVQKDWIEKVVVFYTVNYVLRDSEIDRIANRLVALQNQEDLLLPVLRRQLTETEKALDNLVNAIQQGLLTSTTKKRLDELEAQKENIETSIMEAELQHPKYTKEQIVFYINQFKYGDVNSKDYQQRIIDIFVNSVYLFDDKIVFTYNYKDGTETISFMEMEASLGSDLVSECPPSKPGAKSAPGFCFAAG
ncbi:recombinase family protein [Solibaculum mannosilyticum]|uniref:recombinase family protein n=1 Tax=Solibaculum mannosilyticum TaxID=2780922 RepID=UPI0007A7C664|nr:hypothetical protein BN3661_00729 [Eubacteriaceae bacterium CHKCI005]